MSFQGRGADGSVFSQQGSNRTFTILGAATPFSSGATPSIIPLDDPSLGIGFDSNQIYFLNGGVNRFIVGLGGVEISGSLNVNGVVGAEEQVLKIVNGLPQWQPESPLVVREADGTPINSNTTTIIFPNASVLSSGNEVQVVFPTFESGLITGPGSSTDNAVVRWDGTSGTVIQDSNMTLSDTGDLTIAGNVVGGTWQASVIDEIYGGTGKSSYAVGDLLYADSTTSLAALPAASSGQILTLDGSTPTWSDLYSPPILGQSVATATTPTYTVIDSNYVVAVSGEGLVTVNLPAAPSDGQTHIVKDVRGIAATSGITVDGNGSLIDGLSSSSITNDYQSVTFVFSANAGQWMQI